MRREMFSDKSSRRTWGTRRGVIWMLGTLVLIIVAAEVTSYVANYRAASKAKRLLQDVRTLKVGVTTGDEVQQLIQTYGGNVGRRFGLLSCESVNPPWKTDAVDIQSELLNRIGAYDRVHNANFRRFGATGWSVDASFAVDTSGHLSCVEFVVFSVRARSEALRLSAMYVLPSPDDASAYNIDYQWVHNIQALGAAATTDATPEQLQHVFDFRLDCLKRIGGCREACEVMPSAWTDYQREARSKGWALPPESATNNCPRLADKSN